MWCCRVEGWRRGGDDEDFRAFVVAHWTALTRTAYLVVGDWGTAEDVVQVALSKVHRHWARIERRDVPLVYVRRAVVNAAVSSVRRRRLVEVPLSAVSWMPAGRDDVARAEDRDLLMRALATLPPRMRAVLVLRYPEDLPEAEVAQALGCSVGTVKSQASRGLARLSGAVSPPAASPLVATTAKGGRSEY